MTYGVRRYKKDIEKKSALTARQRVRSKIEDMQIAKSLGISLSELQNMQAS